MKNQILFAIYTCMLIVGLAQAADNSGPAVDSMELKAAKNLYVDANRGNDTNPGILAKPLKTIQQAARVMSAGDICHIRGGVYRETVTPTKDGLSFKNYKNEYVLITGLDIIKGWKSYKNGIMQAPSNTKITQVFVDGKRMHWARYPNEDGDMLSTDDLDLVNIRTQKPTGLVTFTRMESKPDDYWLGAYFMGIPTTRNWWTGHRGRVESSTGKTITCTDLSGLWKNPAAQFTGDGAGYIIGHLNALDSLGEWHWQDNTLYLQPPEGSDVNTSLIEGRTRVHGFNLTDKNNMTLEGLHFKAADIHMPESDHCTISKCTVRYGGPFETFYVGGRTQREAFADFENGASCIFVGGDHNVVKDCYVGRTWTHGFALWGNNNLLENSIAEQCNWQAERISPIWAPGNDNKILRNTSRYSARDGIELGNQRLGIKVAHRALVQYNHVHHHGYLIPDSGLLYVNNQRSSPLAESEISYNILHDFMIDHPGSVGIYLDNSSSGYKVHHNIVWNARDGIRTRTARENYFINNTLMDVTNAIEVRGGELRGGVIVTQNNLVISDEQLYGKTKSHNLVADLNDFIDADGRDYGLKAGAAAIDAGIHVEGITDNAVGKPDIGAIEFGAPDWREKVGATIQVPEFPDEEKGWSATPKGLLSGSSVVAKTNPGSQPEIQINYRSPLNVWLKIPEVSKTLSESSTPIRGGYFAWIGNASLRWEVEVPENDDYEVYLTANVTEAGDGKKITIEAEGKQADFTINKTTGPFPGGENFRIKEALNFERKQLSGTIPLEAGKQIITVSTSGIETEEALFHIRGIELLPVSKKEFIAAEEARAISARASFDWMAETGYGLMFHWTSGTPQRDGTRKPYEEAVNDFDVEKFVNMVDETGAGYVIFPIGHAQSYCPAPIKSWERIHPGQTTQRDLIEELANALNAKDISLICYINIPLAFKFQRTREGVTPEVVEAITANFKAILTELGMRYKDKIAGYWFDTSIRYVPPEEFFNAAKVGNKDRLIARNSFYWQATTAWQDYWAGEVQHPIAPPVNGYMENGICPNLPYHVLLTMEKFSWGVGRGGQIQDPKFTSEELASYIKACMENGGAVTVNMGIYQDGTVGEKALQVMRGVKESIR